MTLRRRLMLMAAVAVGLTVSLASLACYVAMRSELRAQVDHRLRAQGELVQRIGALRGGAPPAPSRRAGAERRLVADASHELRTPVTSLRTNMEVLLAGAELEEGERRALLRDMVGQSEELSGLVADLIELARGDDGDPRSRRWPSTSS